MTTITIDTETVPQDSPWVRDMLAEKIKPPANYKKQETIDKWEAEVKPGLLLEKLHKCGLKGETAQIVCVCIKIDDEPVEPVFGADEPGILDHIAHQLALTGRSLIVGHNVGFDIKMLRQRCLVNGIKLPNWVPSIQSLKPWSGDYFDTMAQWGGTDMISLDTLAKVMGVNRDGNPIPGSEVWQAYKEGRIDDIAQHCVNDVDTTYEIYQRMTGQC